MLQRVLSPVLVGRQDELSQLEDALLSANRGDGSFVLLAGEAGIGKTRLATELTRRARKLGCDVLWGSCSEAELALPYLPFVEAVGNHLGAQDPVELRAALGPTLVVNVMGLLLAFGLAIPIGIASAWRQEGPNAITYTVPT